MALSVVALHVQARILDYYSTKYAAKPMEQLQNLATQYALGLRRLEAEEAQETPAAGNTEPQKKTAKRRGKRVMLRLQHAASRSK
jgi:hypothetical protein